MENGVGDGTLDVIDPSTGEVIAAVSTAGEAECEAAVTAAHNAFPEWAKTAPRYRAEILRKAFELMVAEADYLATLISKEWQVFTDAQGEVMYAAEIFVGSPKKLFALLEIFARAQVAISESLLHINQLVSRY
jgi:acyl-CoA reductase-like NAD-dependent aldehyde dehydrogenase